MASFRLFLQALYLAKDMDFLVAAPIPMRSVFLAKLLEAILPTFILVLVFATADFDQPGCRWWFPRCLLSAGFFSAGMHRPRRRRDIKPVSDGGGAHLPGKTGGGNPDFFRSPPYPRHIPVYKPDE